VPDKELGRLEPGQAGQHLPQRPGRELAGAARPVRELGETDGGGRHSLSVDPLPHRACGADADPRTPSTVPAPPRARSARTPRTTPRPPASLPASPTRPPRSGRAADAGGHGVTRNELVSTVATSLEARVTPRPQPSPVVS